MQFFKSLVLIFCLSFTFLKKSYQNVKKVRELLQMLMKRKTFSVVYSEINQAAQNLVVRNNENVIKISNTFSRDQKYDFLSETTVLLLLHCKFRVL